MPKNPDGTGPERTISVLATLSPRELRTLEKVMVDHGFRSRGRALLWAMLVLGGELELAERARPHAARERALERRRVRVVLED